MSRRLDEINRRLLDTLAVIEETKSLATTLQVIRLAERGYLLTGEQQYVQSVDITIATFTRQLEELRSHVGQSERFDALEREFTSMIEETIRPLMAMRTENGSEVLDQGMLLSLMGEARLRADALIDKLNDFEEEQDELLLLCQAEVDRWAWRDRTTTLFGPIIIVVAFLVAGLYTVSRLDRYKRQQTEDRASIRYARDRLAAVIDSSNLGTW